MSEYTAFAEQIVAAGSNVLFTDAPIDNSTSIVHRAGSGIITLRGLTRQCRARFRVSFGANIAIPTGGTVGPISLAIAIDGEAVPATTMIVTPAAVEQFFNVGADVFVDVPRGCCATISVQNISTEAIEVQNANLIVTREA